MAKRKWVQQWSVPSKTELGKFYTVSKDKSGKLFCSCPASVFQKLECSHIKSVLEGESNPVETEPEYILAAVREVTPVWEDGQVVKVHVPLMPIGDEHFEATLINDCLRCGVRIETLRKRAYSLTKNNSKAAILEYVQSHGRKIWYSIEPRDRRFLIKPLLNPIPVQTKETVGGLLFVYGENDSQYFWETSFGEDRYFLISPKDSPKPYWAVLVNYADGRFQPLNTAVFKDGKLIDADPLYRSDEKDEPSALTWMERLSEYLTTQSLKVA